MSDTIDYAIVGAGCAGTYVAWRLQNTQRLEGKTVRVYETTLRPGGRLLSVPMPGTSYKAELGGMRFTANQLLLCGLIDVLRQVVAHPDKLDVKPFNFETKLMYLRGQHRRPDVSMCGACGTHLRMPYQLGEHGVTEPAALVKRALAQALKAVRFDSEELRQLRPKDVGRIEEKLRDLDEEGQSLRRSTFTTNEWALIKRYGVLNDRPLYELGFWNLLSHYLQDEEFLFTHDALGYESILANWNAAEAIPWFLSDFDVDGYLTVKGGMDEIPLSLTALFRGKRPDAINYKFTLKSVEQHGKEELKLNFETPTGLVTVPTKHAVLALPKEALKGIDFSPLGRERHEKFRRLLEHVTAHPLFKLLLGYEHAWWRDVRALGASSGRVTTDLPIRQVYYFEPAEGAVTGPAMLMASYSDEHYVDFWQPLEKREGTPAYFKSDAALDEDANAALRGFGAIEPMVKKAHRQIEKLHPGLSIPEPFVGLVKNWMDQPSWGGWHSWNPRVEVWNELGRIRHPFEKLPIYVCGEAFSTEQGWVEGALKSAEGVLRELGIDRPTWIPDAQYSKHDFGGYDEYIDN